MSKLAIILAMSGVGATLIGFVCFLLFCVFVVVRTGGTSGLRDVAVAMRAYSLIGSFRRTSRP